MADNLIYLVADKSKLTCGKNKAHELFCKIAISNGIEFNQNGFYYCGSPAEQYAQYDDYYWTVKSDQDKNLILLLSDQAFKVSTPGMVKVPGGSMEIGYFND